MIVWLLVFGVTVVRNVIPAFMPPSGPLLAAVDAVAAYRRADLRHLAYLRPRRPAPESRSQYESEVISFAASDAVVEGNSPSAAAVVDNLLARLP